MNYAAALLHGECDVRVERRAPRALGAGELRIRLAYGGICGTDLHYWKQFGNAGFRLRAPVVLGHEASGVVVEIGGGIEGFAVGDKVVVDPLMACGSCASCSAGHRNLCERKRYPGSATTIPHIDGYFRDLFEAPAGNCHRLSPSADLSQMAATEPLACSLHAVAQAGPILGARVLVTGAGPIGTLTAAAARLAGAGHVTLADIADAPLLIGARMGADETLNSRSIPVAEHIARGGDYDVAIEASGAPSALSDCIAAVRRGGHVVQLGIAPDAASLDGNRVMLREITLRGSNQYTKEFAIARDMILEHRIDVTPLFTQRFTVAEAAKAFDIAADRERSMKVLLVGEAA